MKVQSICELFNKQSSTTKNMSSSDDSNEKSVTELIDAVPYADGELSNIERRRVLLLIKEETQFMQPYQSETIIDTPIDSTPILKNTYIEFIKNNKKLPTTIINESIQSQLQNDKNQKINLSLLQPNAKSHWTFYVNELNQQHESLQQQKQQIQQQVTQLQAKRKREQLEFSNRERVLKDEMWSLVRSSFRVNKGVQDLETTCSKYRRILDEQQQQPEE
jgi:hypothetical protein